MVLENKLYTPIADLEIVQLSRKKFKGILAILILIGVTSCSDTNTLNSLSNEEFLEFISNENYKESIGTIDSLITTGTYSNYKTGFLYYEKGRLLANLEKDAEAIGSLNKALPLFTKEKDTMYIAKTNMLLGDSNAFLSNNNLATQHTNEALRLYRKIGYKEGEAKVLNSLGHLEFLKANFKTSIAYVKAAAKIQEEINNLEGIAASYNNIGYILEQLKDYEEAKNYYEKARKLNKENNRLNSNPQRNLGYVYFLENNFKKSKKYYLEALEIEKKTGVHVLQKEIYDGLLEVSIKDKSFENSSLYVAKRDSLNALIIQLENEEKIKLIKNQYKLIAENKALEQEKQKNNKNKIILGIFIGLLSFLGLFLAQRNKNTKLKLYQEKLELEQKMLRTQMNPHFIFNALTAIQNTLFDENPIKASNYLSRFATLIRQNFEFVNKKEITLVEDLDALKNYIETQQLRFENKFDYQIQVQEDIDTSFIKIPPMVLQPFVENAIEHGLKPKKEKGFLKVHISEKEQYLRFDIIDNGVGFINVAQKDDREHAIEIFLKRLKHRNLDEEKHFSIQPAENGFGTKVTIFLNLT